MNDTCETKKKDCLLKHWSSMTHFSELFSMQKKKQNKNDFFCRKFRSDLGSKSHIKVDIDDMFVTIAMTGRCIRRNGGVLDNSRGNKWGRGMDGIPSILQNSLQESAPPPSARLDPSVWRFFFSAGGIGVQWKEEGVSHWTQKMWKGVYFRIRAVLRISNIVKTVKTCCTGPK